MKLKLVKPANVKGYLVLGVEADGKTDFYTVSERQYAVLSSPLTSDELDEGRFRMLVNFSEGNRAVKKALSILSFGDNSENALVAKLQRAGFSSDVSRSVARQMCELGYLNEERQLERLISLEVNTHLTGARKFIPKLYRKGYSVSKIKAVAAELAERGEIDFADARRRLIEKHGVSDSEEIKKLLFKYGF